MIVNLFGVFGILVMVLFVYCNVELKMVVVVFGCGVSWNLLVGIGCIELMYVNGGVIDVCGIVIQLIYGLMLDGILLGNEIII